MQEKFTDGKQASDQERLYHEIGAVAMPIIKQKGVRDARPIVTGIISGRYPNIESKDVVGIVDKCIQEIMATRGEELPIGIFGEQRMALLKIINSRDDENSGEFEIPGSVKDMDEQVACVCSLIDDENVDMKGVYKIVRKMCQAYEKKGDPGLTRFVTRNLARHIFSRFGKYVPSIAGQKDAEDVLNAFRNTPVHVIMAESSRTGLIQELQNDCHPARIVPPPVGGGNLSEGTELGRLKNLLSGMTYAVSELLGQAQKEDGGEIKKYLEKNPELVRIYHIIDKRSTAFPDTNYVTKKSTDIHGDEEVLCGDHFIIEKETGKKYVTVSGLVILRRILVDIFNELFPPDMHLRMQGLEVVPLVSKAEEVAPENKEKTTTSQRIALSNSQSSRRTAQLLKEGNVDTDRIRREQKKRKNRLQ